MDVDDFRRLLARKGQADAENEAAQRAEEAEAAAEQAAEPEAAVQPVDGQHTNGVVAMELDERHAAEDPSAATGQDVAAALAASAALKQQEAAALASTQQALRVCTAGCCCRCLALVLTASAPCQRIVVSVSAAGPVPCMESCVELSSSSVRCRAQDKQEAKRQRHEMRERLRQLKAQECQQKRDQRKTELLKQHVRFPPSYLWGDCKSSGCHIRDFQQDRTRLSASTHRAWSRLGAISQVW